MSLREEQCKKVCRILDDVLANRPTERDSLIVAVRKVFESEPHWIPVTERLPEYGLGVLTYNRDEEFEINHIIDDEDGEWFYDGVIAWMPLPEPYKGVTE